MIADVDRDLRGLRRKGGRVEAAANAARNAYPWIEQASFDDPEDLDRIDLIRDVIDTYREPPKGDDRHENEDYVDAASIVWAMDNPGSELVMHDNCANMTARDRGLVTVTFVDVLRFHTRGKTLALGKAWKMYQSLHPEFDPGEGLRDQRELL